MLTEREWERITDALDRYARSVRRHKAAAIDAACCQTSRDWQLAHEREEEEYHERDLTEAEIRKVIFEVVKRAPVSAPAKEAL